MTSKLRQRLPRSPRLHRMHDREPLPTFNYGWDSLPPVAPKSLVPAAIVGGTDPSRPQASPLGLMQADRLCRSPRWSLISPPPAFISAPPAAVSPDDGALKVRIVGIDMPETVHPVGPVEGF
jgi:hypothetical protein